MLFVGHLAPGSNPPAFLGGELAEEYVVEVGIGIGGSGAAGGERVG